MDANQLTELCRGARAAVRAAGSIVQKHWNRPRQVTHKGRIDLVTETDLAVEADLRESLGRLSADIGYYAEESAGAMSLPDLSWVVDPVDGTTNFVHGLPFVAISVGLWSTDGMLCGIVYNPILEEFFWAQKGRGTYLNDSPVSVSTTPDLEQSLVATGFPYAILEHKEAVLGWLDKVLARTQGVRRCGAAALDLAYVACGRYDAFYETSLHPWDMAGGWLLVEEAGGSVSAFGADQARPFDLFSPAVLASNRLLHAQMSALLAL